MKKKFFYIAMVALALTGCSDSLSTIGSSDDNSEITIPADAEAGELLIKFSPEMSDILDQAQLSKTRAGKATRSGIPSTDEVLDILRAVASVEVVLFLRELDDGTCKLSARAKSDYPVNELAARFGGGGHRKTAGATLPGPLDEAKARVVAALLSDWQVPSR